MSEKALTPIEQKTVVFYDDEITAVRLEGDSIVIPLRPICEALGLNWAGQRQRLHRDMILNEVSCECVIHSQGQGRSMLCLPLEYLNGFLFGINAGRVKEEIRDRLLRYQRESYAVLYEAFQEGRLSASPIEDLLKSDSAAAEAYRLAMAVVKLARHQLLLESTQQQHGKQLIDHETRLETLETAIGPGTAVSQDQASQISQAVKAVAIAMGKQTKRNEFGAVYGELYRKYGVTSYKLLPVDKFDEAMKWLSEWYQSLEGDAPF